MLKWTVLTMPELWICLIILHFRQAFEFASGSKYARVLNIARMYIQGLQRVLDMSEYDSYASIISEYASICLNVHQYAWTWLNIVACPWISWKLQWLYQSSQSCLNVDRVLNMPEELNIPGFWLCRDIDIIALLLL